MDDMNAELTSPSESGLDRFGMPDPSAPRTGLASAWAIWHHWVPIRTLAERHRSRIEQHLLQLEPEDRRLRFGATTSDDQIRQYVRSLDFCRDEIFGIFDRRLQLVAMAHLAYSAAPQRRNHPAFVEFGVSVRRQARGRGYGNRLFAHSVLHARNRHTETLFIHALTENAAMLRIAMHNGATLEYSGPDATAWLRLPSDTVSTHVSSALETAAAETSYGLRRQAQRLTQAVKRLLSRAPWAT